MIIDHLRSDHFALAACGAVCRAWLPSSRSRLLHSLELRPHTSEEFLGLLDSPFTTIPPYVRSLSIYGAATRRGEEPSSWMDDTLPHLACLLRVQSLRLCEFYWRDLRAKTRNALISSFLQVTKLSLTYFSFDKFEGLVELLCSYPSLEHIYFGDVFWPEGPSLASTSKRLPACFRHLDLGICPKEDLIEALFSHSTSAVDTVFLSYITMQQVRPIAMFLRNLGHNLHHLRMDFIDLQEEEIGVQILSASLYYEPQPYCIVESFCNVLDLVHNDQLRSIRLRDKFRSLVGGKLDMDRLAGILSQIVSDRIELVELAITPRFLHIIDLIDWSPLAKVFAKPKFAALRLIRITVSGRTIQEVADLVRKALPDCDARGILDFPRDLDSRPAQLFLKNIILEGMPDSQ